MSEFANFLNLVCAEAHKQVAEKMDHDLQWDDAFNNEMSSRNKSDDYQMYFWWFEY